MSDEKTPWFKAEREDCSLIEFVEHYWPDKTPSFSEYQKQVLETIAQNLGVPKRILGEPRRSSWGVPSSEAAESLRRYRQAMNRELLTMQQQMHEALLLMFLREQQQQELDDLYRSQWWKRSEGPPDWRCDRNESEWWQGDGDDPLGLGA